MQAVMHDMWSSVAKMATRSREMQSTTTLNHKVHELALSEEGYVHFLVVLQELYAKPLQEAARTCDVEELEMFPELDVFSTIHQDDLLPCFRRVDAEFSATDLAATIAKHSDSLREAYTTYAERLDDVVANMAAFRERLTSAEKAGSNTKRDNFRTSFRESIASPGGGDLWADIMSKALGDARSKGQPLHTLMVTPLLRVYRLRTILAQIAMLVDNDEDKKRITQAAQWISETAAAIDEARHTSESHTTGRQVQDRLKNAYDFGYEQSNPLELHLRPLWDKRTMMTQGNKLMVELMLFEGNPLLIVCTQDCEHLGGEVNVFVCHPSDCRLMWPGNCSTFFLALPLENFETTLDAASTDVAGEWCHRLWADGATGNNSSFHSVDNEDAGDCEPIPEADEELLAPASAPDSGPASRSGEEDFETPVMAIPDWKRRTLKANKQIQAEADALAEEERKAVVVDGPPVDAKAFEAVLDQLGVPEESREGMRTMDDDKKRTLMMQVGVDPAAASGSSEEDLEAPASNADEDNFETPVMAIPDWKRRTLKANKQIQAEADALAEEERKAVVVDGPPVDAKAFEAVLDQLGVPEESREGMRTMDDDKKRTLMLQAGLDPTAVEVVPVPAEDSRSGTVQQQPDTGELDEPAMRVPAWKLRQMERHRKMEQDTQNTLQAEGMSDEEFEKVLDKLGIPEEQRVVMRKFDGEKRKKLAEQAAQASDAVDGAVDGAPAAAVMPKWKLRQMAKQKQIDDEVNQAANGPPPAAVTDEEFEKVLDKLGIPEPQREAMRGFDDTKRAQLMEQAKAVPSPAHNDTDLANNVTDLANDDTDLAGAAGLAIPKWKQRQLQRNQEIMKRASIDATPQFTKPTASPPDAPAVTDAEFENVLDSLQVPEEQRVAMRKFDDTKRRMFMEQAKAAAAATPPHKSRSRFSKRGSVSSVTSLVSKLVSPLKSVKNSSSSSASNAPDTPSTGRNSNRSSARSRRATAPANASGRVGVAMWGSAKNAAAMLSDESPAKAKSHSNSTGSPAKHNADVSPASNADVSPVKSNADVGPPKDTPASPSKDSPDAAKQPSEDRSTSSSPDQPRNSSNDSDDFAAPPPKSKDLEARAAAAADPPSGGPLQTPAQFCIDTSKENLAQQAKANIAKQRAEAAAVSAEEKENCTPGDLTGRSSSRSYSREGSTSAHSSLFTARERAQLLERMDELKKKKERLREKGELRRQASGLRRATLDSEMSMSLDAAENG